MIRRIAAVVSLVSVLLSLATGEVRGDSIPQFQLTDLGVMTGRPESEAVAINNVGQVVGYSSLSGSGDQAFLYSNGVLTGISGTPGVQFARALGINNDGDIVGWGSTNQALLFSGGVTQDLGPVVGGAVSQARGINDSGLITGIAVNGPVNTRAFIYDPANGTITNILPPYQSVTYPLAINNQGQVVGYSGVTPFLYSHGTITYLPSFGGNQGSANGINNLGQVVGYSDIASGNGSDAHAFLYSNGVMTDLTPLGQTSSSANGINDSGWIVGEINGGAFLDVNGVLSSLASLTTNSDGWILNDATAINDRGQIVGWGTYSDGQQRAFLLTAVPEPSSLLLAGLGLALCLGFASIRRPSEAI
jgi:probable HAF family extracellular repeat protein